MYQFFALNRKSECVYDFNCYDHYDNIAWRTFFFALNYYTLNVIVKFSLYLQTEKNGYFFLLNARRSQIKTRRKDNTHTHE